MNTGTVLFKKGISNMLKLLDTPQFIDEILDKTTIKSIPYLKTINNLGMITSQSQEGEIYKGDYGIIKERAFLEGFMEVEHSKRFVEWMNTNSEFICFIIHILPEKYKCSSVPRITVTVQGKDANKLEGYTRLCTCVEKTEFEFEKINYAKLDPRTKVNQVVCVDPVYGRDAGLFLYKMVIEGLEKC